MRAIAVVLMLVVGLGCNKAEEQRKRHEVEKLEAEKKQAELAAAEAAKDVEEQTKKINDLVAKSTELDKKVDEAVQAVANAQNDADRKAAAATLEALRKEKADLQTTMESAKAQGEKLERLKGVKISKECMDNPLAKGCE